MKGTKFTRENLQKTQTFFKPITVPQSTQYRHIQIANHSHITVQHKSLSHSNSHTWTEPYQIQTHGQNRGFPTSTVKTAPPSNSWTKPDRQR